MKHPSKVVKPGDQVEAVVLEVHPKDRRISLGLKQLEPNPWTTIDSRYSVGSVVEGRVRNMTDFGAFIEIEEGIDGLVHVSDLSWTKRVKHPREVLKKGQIVQAVILNIDSLVAPPVARHQAVAAGRLGELTSRTIRWAIRCTGGSAGWPASALLWNWPKAWKGSAISPRFRAIPAARIGRAAACALGEEYDFKIIKMSEAGEEDRAQPAGRHRRRGEDPPGRLPAPGGRRHHHHRRSHEFERPQPGIRSLQIFEIHAILRFRNLG